MYMLRTFKRCIARQATLSHINNKNTNHQPMSYMQHQTLLYINLSRVQNDRNKPYLLIAVLFSSAHFCRYYTPLDASQFPTRINGQWRTTVNSNAAFAFRLFVFRLFV